MPAMNATDRVRVTRIATAPNEFVAELWRAVLAEEGIVVALQPGGAGFALAGMNTLNEQHILVREDQSARALEILADLAAEDDDADSDPAAWAGEEDANSSG